MVSPSAGIFQRQMTKILEGVVFVLDDLLVYGRTVAEAVLKRIKGVEMMLNKNMCKFLKTKLRFLDHVVGKEGVEQTLRKCKQLWT